MRKFLMKKRENSNLQIQFCNKQNSSFKNYIKQKPEMKNKIEREKSYFQYFIFSQFEE